MRRNHDWSFRPYPFEALFRFLPTPTIIAYKIGPAVVIGAWSSSIHAKVDGSTSSQSFPSAVVEFPFVESLLTNSLVTPVVAWRSQGPSSLAEFTLT